MLSETLILPASLSVPYCIAGGGGHSPCSCREHLSTNPYGLCKLVVTFPGCSVLHVDSPKRDCHFAVNCQKQVSHEKCELQGLRIEFSGRMFAYHARAPSSNPRPSTTCGLQSVTCKRRSTKAGKAQLCQPPWQCHGLPFAFSTVTPSECF